jgi:hypothetical protein
VTRCPRAQPLFPGLYLSEPLVQCLARKDDIRGCLLDHGIQPCEPSRRQGIFALGQVGADLRGFALLECH